MWFWLGGTQKGVAADDSKELLRRLRIVTKRPKNDRDLTDQNGYLFLTDAQVQLLYRVAPHIPNILKGVPEKMTTTDGGLTYTTSKEALGHIEVYPAPYRDPLIEGPLWVDWADYTREGPRTIRMNQGRARTFTDGPYARYVKKPGVIDDSSQPTLEPNDLRRLIPYLAAELWAESGGTYDPSPYRRQLQKQLWGDPESEGDVGLIPAYKLLDFSSGGAETTTDLWWRSPDLGVR